MAHMVKNLPSTQETQIQSLGWEDPRRRKWQPTPVFLPGKSHGERSLAGHSAWGRKESDPTEHTHHRAHAKSLSRVQLSATPWTAAHQAPLSMAFSRQEYWSGLLFPSPEDLTNPGIKPESLKSPALAGRFFTTRAS